MSQLEYFLLQRESQRSGGEPVPAAGPPARGRGGGAGGAQGAHHHNPQQQQHHQQQQQQLQGGGEGWGRLEESLSEDSAVAHAVARHGWDGRIEHEG